MYAPSGRLEIPPVFYSWVVQNWVKFHILIYLSPMHKYPIKEGFLTNWGVKKNKKPFRQNHKDFFIAIESLWFCRHGLIFKFRPLLVGEPFFLVHLCKKLEYIISRVLRDSTPRYAGPSVGWSVGWLVGWLVGRSPSYFFGVLSF